jgi:DNA-binding transcriptional MocR family regulator
MRLAFSLCALEQIDEGVRRLAEVVTETIASCKAGARS